MRFARVCCSPGILRILTVYLFSLLAYTGYAATISAMAGPQLVGQFGNSIWQPGTVYFIFPAPTGSSIGHSSVSFSSAIVDAYSNCGSAANCGVFASAKFSDAITIFGRSGIIQADIEMSSVALFGDGISTSSFHFGNMAGSSSGSFYGGPGTCGMGICSFQQSFAAGSKLLFSGDAYVIASDTAPQDPGTGSVDDRAKVIFSFSVLDATGHPLSGFQFTSDSGTDYGLVGGVFIPEPMTMVLAPSGFLLLILLAAVSQSAMQVACLGRTWARVPLWQDGHTSFGYWYSVSRGRIASGRSTM